MIGNLNIQSGGNVTLTGDNSSPGELKWDAASGADFKMSMNGIGTQWSALPTADGLGVTIGSGSTYKVSSFAATAKSLIGLYSYYSTNINCYFELSSTSTVTQVKLHCSSPTVTNAAWIKMYSSAADSYIELHTGDEVALKINSSAIATFPDSINMQRVGRP